MKTFNDGFVGERKLASSRRPNPIKSRSGDEIERSQKRMPKYDYECEEGHTFEIWQGINDDRLETCPVSVPIAKDAPYEEVCNAPVKRLISNTNFVLKGKGWYKDGY